jgi:WD40 repeat protein
MKKQSNISIKIAIDSFLLKIVSSCNLGNKIGLLFAKKIIVSSFDSYLKKITINTQSDSFINSCFRRNDQRIVATSRESKKIDIIDLQKGLILRSLDKHSSLCHALSFSNNGTNLISSGDDGNVIIWDISLQKHLYSMKISRKALRSVFYWPENNQIFASSGYEGLIKFIDIRSNNLTVASFNHGCPVEHFKFTNNGERIISIGGNVLKVWNLREKKLEFLVEEKKAITQLNLDRADTVFYSGLNNSIKFFKLNSYKLHSQFVSKKDIITFACLSNRIIIGFSDKILSIKNSSFDKKIYKTKKQLEPRKNITCSNIFFLPKKKIKNFRYQENILNKKYLKAKKKKNSSFIILKRSIDNLVRKNKIKKIFDILYENKKFSIVFMVINEVIYQRKIETILPQIEGKHFLFLINRITENLKIISTPIFLWMVLKISENYFPIIYLFNSYYKIETYLKILNNLFKKSYKIYNLRFAIEMKNFCF